MHNRIGIYDFQTRLEKQEIVSRIGTQSCWFQIQVYVNAWDRTQCKLAAGHALLTQVEARLLELGFRPLLSFLTKCGLIIFCVAGNKNFKVSSFSSLIAYRSDEGLTLETSAFLLFTVANLRFQPSC